MTGYPFNSLCRTQQCNTISEKCLLRKLPFQNQLRESFFRYLSSPVISFKTYHSPPIGYLKIRSFSRPPVARHKELTLFKTSKLASVKAASTTSTHRRQMDTIQHSSNKYGFGNIHASRSQRHIQVSVYGTIRRYSAVFCIPTQRILVAGGCVVVRWRWF
jgi:hypothetical protein